MNFGGAGGDGHWGIEDSAKSYVDYNLAHGKTPGGSGGGGGSGGRTGCWSAVIFIGVLFGSIALLSSAGVPAVAAVFIALLILAGVGGGLVGLSKLLTRKPGSK